MREREERETEERREIEEKEERACTHSTMRIIRQTTSNRAIPNMAPAEAPIIMPTDISVPVIGIPDATMTPSPPVLTART